MRGLGRVFAHAAVRKLAGLLVLALLAWAGIGRAEAACSGSSCATKQEAYDKVRWTGSDFCPVYGVPNGVETATYVETDVTATTGRVTAYYKCNGSTVASASATWASVCPAGQTWNPVTYTCSEPCSANAPPLGKTSLQVPPGTAENPWANTPSGACVNGCAFGGSLDKQERTIVDGVKYVTYSSMEPTGGTCAAGDQDWFPPLTPPPDGDGDGSSDGNDPDPTNPGTGSIGKPGPDGQPPPDGTGNGTGQGSGNGNQSTGGGNCQTPPSSNGDAIAAQIAYQTWATRCAVEALGKGKTSTGVVLPGTGTGTGEGDGSGAGNAVPGFGDGQLYERTDKTVESVYADFKAEMMGTEFGQAFTGFIGSCQGGGSCPTASWEASTWGISASLAELCAGALGSLLEFAGWVFLAGMAWFGYRVALL